MNASFFLFFKPPIMLQKAASDVPRKQEGGTGNELGKDGGRKLVSTTHGCWVPWGYPRSHVKCPQGCLSVKERGALVSSSFTPWGVNSSSLLVVHVRAPRR